MRLCPRCRASYSGDERFCVVDARPLIDEASLARVGTVVGNYRLTDVLGRGGMGTVYKGEHVYIGRQVALKVLHERFARYEEAVKRFLREARAASSINHPNIVDVMDFGPLGDGDGVYFAMEFIEGERLEDVIERDAPLALHRAITILSQIASALAAAHEQGIVHRDLKPENVMLTRRPGRRDLVHAHQDPSGGQRFVIEPEGSYDFVKILDFGIAKVLEPDAADHSVGTAVGTIIGTPAYMSPEAAKGLPDVDHRADIYALGVIFYDLLTGHPPFEGGAPVEILSRQIGEAPIPPRQAAPEAEIAEAAERLILRALEKDPARRHQSMEELRDDLRGCFGSVAYKREADRVPGARAAGVDPGARARRLTEELDDWLRQNRDQLVAGQRRLEAQLGVVTEPAAEGTDSEPLLLTRKKPRVD